MAKTMLKTMAALLTGVACLLLAPAAAQAQDRYARTQAECDKLRGEVETATDKAKRNRDAETQALREAQQATTAADAIRKMGGWELDLHRRKMESELTKELEAREEEDRGAFFSKRDARIVRIKATIAGIKDAELRAQDVEFAGGLIASDRNAVDTLAKEMRAKADKAKAKAAEWDYTAAERQRDYDACLAELARQRASADDDGDDQWASADGYDGYDDGAGYDGPMSDADPVRPVYRPRRVRPDRGDRWDRGGYGDPTRVRGDRGRRDDWVRGDARDRRADRGGRDRMKGDRGGKRDKGGRGKRGKGGSCHTNPLTGAQHCGSG